MQSVQLGSPNKNLLESIFLREKIPDLLIETNMKLNEDKVNIMVHNNHIYARLYICIYMVVYKH